MSNQTHHLRRKQFDAIRNDLRTTTRTQAAIAEDHKVSSSMVSLVNNARTYGNYLSNEKAKHPLRERVQPTRTAVKEPTKYEKAERAGLKPLSVEERIEKRFASELEKLNEKYAPYNDVWTNIERLDERIDTVHTNSKKRAADALKIAAKAEYRARLAFIVSVASLVLSIIAIAK